MHLFIYKSFSIIYGIVSLISALAVTYGEEECAHGKCNSHKELTTPSLLWTKECCGGFRDYHYIFVSTMDGRITALDAKNNGNIVWSVDADRSPLLTGNLHEFQIKAFTNTIIPSLDGSLYSINFENDVLKPVLIESSKTITLNDEALVGGTMASTAGVDITTGKILYYCSHEYCQPSKESSSHYTLLIQRVTQQIRAADPFTGYEKWNASVGEYTLYLKSKDKQFSNDGKTPSHISFQIKPPTGELSIGNSCGEMLWKQTLNSPIVKVWQLFDGKLHDVSIFDSWNIDFTENGGSIEDAIDSNLEISYYFGTFNSVPYLMFSNKMQKDIRQSLDHDQYQRSSDKKDVMRRDMTINIPDSTITDLIKKSYKNTAAKESSPESMIQQRSLPAASCYPETSTALSTNTYSKDMGCNGCRGDSGFFVVKRIELIEEGKISRRTREKCKNSLFNTATKKAKRLAKSVEVHLNVDVAVSGWWRICALCLGMVVLIISVVLVIILRRRSRRKIFLGLYTSLSVKQIFLKNSEKETQADKKMIEKKPSNVSLAGLTQSTPSQKTTNSTNSISSSTFTSKFLDDFIPEKCLGRGGFGIVFKCRNTLDDRNYAVKRIAVSRDSTAASDRVLREVRAMAKLDHPGIIRYFHTWMETPPLGWQHEVDKEVLNRLKAKKGEKLKAVEKDIKESSDTSSLIKHFDARSESEGFIDGIVKRSGLKNSFSNVTSNDDDDGSWASEDEIDEVEFSDDSSSSSPSNSDSNHPETAETDTSHIMFVSNSSVVNKIDNNNELSSDDVFAPPAILITSGSNIHHCVKTKDYAYLYIQMELCQELTLHNWLLLNDDESKRDLSKMKHWLAQLVCAVKYIHEKGLIHRDLKPQNIFFSADDINLDTLKIGDLGLATNLESDGFVGSSRDTLTRHTGDVGTRLYMSPEQLAGQVYNEKIDIFSLGLIYAEMMIPFTTMMERHITLEELRKSHLPSALMNKNKPERNFVRWLTTFDAASRPTCQEICECEYLQDAVQLLGSPFCRSRTVSVR